MIILNFHVLRQRSAVVAFSDDLRNAELIMYIGFAAALGLFMAGTIRTNEVQALKKAVTNESCRHDVFSD